MTIRAMTIEDIPAVAAMEAQDSRTPWSDTAILTYFVRDDTLLMVAAGADGEIEGFCGLLRLDPEAEILDITVRHDMRRRGIGEALLTAVLDKAEESGIHTVYLEVREGNLPARRLYEKLRFEAYGRRPRYYTEPVEDAIVMKRLRLC